MFRLMFFGVDGDPCHSAPVTRSTLIQINEVIRTAHCRIQGHIAQLWIRERKSRAIMPEKPRDELKLRHWCIRKLLKGEDVETIRLTAKVSRRTLYYWLERFQRNGGEGLVEKPRRPHIIHPLNSRIVEK